jgi:hypothetical protein
LQQVERVVCTVYGGGVTMHLLQCPHWNAQFTSCSKYTQHMRDPELLAGNKKDVWRHGQAGGGAAGRKKGE